MRLLFVSLAVVLAVCPASAQPMTALWDPSPKALGYKVYIGTASGVYAPAVDVKAATSYDFQRPTPAPNRIYVAVSSYNGTAEGPKSPEVVDPPPEPTPPPQTGPEMTLTAQPGTITAGQTSTLSFTWNAQTRHVVKLDGSPLPCTPVNNVCSGTVSVMPIQTTTYTMTAVFADGSPAPSVETTVTVNPIQPTPPPATQVPPVVTIRSCSEWIEADKPISATGTGWVVQYFDFGEAITTPSATKKRAITLQPGTHRLSGVWSKTGQQPLPSGTTVVVCQ